MRRHDATTQLRREGRREAQKKEGRETGRERRREGCSWQRNQPVQRPCSWWKNEAVRKLTSILSVNAHVHLGSNSHVFIETILLDGDSVRCYGACTCQSPASVFGTGSRSLGFMQWEVGNL